MKIVSFLRNGVQNNWVIQRIRYQKSVFTKPKRGSFLEKEKNIKSSIQQKIRDNIQKAQKNVATNTPRIVGGFMIIFTIPQFKLIYDMLSTEYNDPRFFKKLKLYIEWINIKSAFMLGGIFGLEAVNFIDKKAKYTMGPSKFKFLFLLVPFAFNLGSLAYFDIVDKRIIWGNLTGNVSTFLMETKFTGQGLIPYWLYNIKYHMNIFDIITLGILYHAMKRLKNEMQQKPHNFVELETIK